MNVIKVLLKIGGWILLSIAIIELSVTFFVYRHAQSFVRTASRAEATITRMVERDGGSHGSVYSPVFTFKDSNGQEQEVYSSGGQYPPKYKVGDKVAVLYQKDNPRDAKIDTFLDLWIWPVGLAVFGLIDLFSAIVPFVALYFIGRYERTASTKPAA